MILHLHPQGILVHQQGVAQPVGNGIFLLGSFHHERILRIKVQSADNGQVVITIAVHQGEPVRLLAFILRHVTIGLHLSESPQYDIVGEEMSIGHLHDVFDMQGVAPDGVLTDIRLAAGHDDVSAECDLLTLLVIEVVSVGIHQGIYTIVTGLDALDDETSTTVGTTHALEGFLAEYRVGKVIIESNQDTLDGFQVLRLIYIARHLHRIYLGARRERVGVVT